MSRCPSEAQHAHAARASQAKRSAGWRLCESHIRRLLFPHIREVLLVADLSALLCAACAINARNSSGPTHRNADEARARRNTSNRSSTEAAPNTRPPEEAAGAGAPAP